MTIANIVFRKEDLVGLKTLLNTEYKQTEEAYSSEDSNDFVSHVIVHCIGCFDAKTGATLAETLDINAEDLIVERVNDHTKYGSNADIRLYSLVAYFATLCARHLAEAVQKPSTLFPGKMTWGWTDDEDEDTLTASDLAERISWYIDELDEETGELTGNWAHRYLPGMGGYCDMDDWVASYGGPHPINVDIQPEIVFE